MTSSCLGSFVQLREYRVQLDMTLPAPLDVVAGWLLKAEEALAEEVGEPQDHGRAADDAREKQELLKVRISCIQRAEEVVLTLRTLSRDDRSVWQVNINVLSAGCCCRSAWRRCRSM